MTNVAWCAISCALLVSTGETFSSPGAAALDKAVARLENWRADYGSSELKECTETVRSIGSKGDEVLGNRLKFVVGDRDLPVPVRREALRVSCALADSGQAAAIIAQLSDWVCQLTSSEPDVRSETQAELRARAVLVSVGVTESLADLQSAVSDQQPLLELLTAIAKYKQFELTEAASSAILNNPGPIELRKRCALDIIAATAQDCGSPDSLVKLIDPTMFPVLRELVRDSLNGEHFHFQAASVLAHYGDEEILPTLQTAKRGLAMTTKYGADFVAEDIWKIHAQHPPHQLCAYIASTDPRLERGWAIKRALELGVGRGEIRSAILEYVRRLRSEHVGPSDPRMVVIKYRGLRYGVLDPSDLADVDIAHLPDDLGI